ncbi:MAG: polysaccharide deacetylase family protein [Faecalibacterium sp.]
MELFHSLQLRRTIRIAAMVLLGVAAGFGLGLEYSDGPVIGCRQTDLTPMPDQQFLASPSTSDTSGSGTSNSAVLNPAPDKWVCLTFDDGPSKTTAAVLDALNSAQVHATFFVVATGYNDKYLPLISQAAAQGHQIALHSATHEYSNIYQSQSAYWQDIALLKERIASYVDAASIHYLRFPGGSTNTVSRRYGGKGLMSELKNDVEDKGYQWVDWNVCAEDAVGGKPSAEQIYRNVIQETGDQQKCVVLMHDSSTTQTTAEALPDIIQWYKENGYTFCTVEQVIPLHQAQLVHQDQTQ